MRLHFDSANARTRVTAYGNGYVVINEVRYQSSLILSAEQVHTPWRPQSVAELIAEDMANLMRCLETPPEIILLGTGPRQFFPPAAILQPVYEKGVGLEIMDTNAACRTFNVLAAEDRVVAAGLIMT